MSLEIRDLDPETPLDVLDALDRVLDGCRAELVGPRGHLESLDERLVDADDRRILLYARLAGAPVAVLDAHLHHPGLHDMTVAQIAVAPEARRRGLARTLLVGALEAALRRDAPPRLVYAAVRANAHGAAAFWSHLGLTESPEHPELLWAPAEIFG